MRFAVLGSNSFSGSHFVTRLLRAGHDVIGVSRSEEIVEVFRPYTWQQMPGRFTFAQIDINDGTALAVALNDFAPDVVVNFAYCRALSCTFCAVAVIRVVPLRDETGLPPPFGEPMLAALSRAPEEPFGCFSTSKLQGLTLGRLSRSLFFFP